MQNLYHQTKDTFKIIILAAILVVGVQYVFAQTWDGPTQGPPNGNPAPPINTSTSDQTKCDDFSCGGLAVGSFNADNTQIDGFLKITSNDFTLGTGKIRFFDGLPEWYDGSKWRSFGSWTADADGNISYTGGNVTVGDTGIGIDKNNVTYFQIDAVNINIPEVTDCDNASEFGRMVFDIDTHFLYICGDTAPDPTTGAYWRRIVTTTP